MSTISPPRRIPLEDFFRKPERIKPRLSPSGRHLAYLAPYERRMNLRVRDLETGDEVRVTDTRQRDIAGYLWANDDRLIYVQDRGGDENYRLYGVGRDGSDPCDYTPFDGVKCSIVDDLEEIDDEVLFQMNRKRAEVFDVYRLDVRTGKTTLVAENPGNVQRWITDHSGRLRLARTTDGVNTSILYRDTEAAPWRPVATYDFREWANPLFFTLDDRAIYVASNVGRDRTAIFEYDLEGGREGRLIFEHAEVDVSALLHSKHRRRITGVIFHTARPCYHFFESHDAEIQRFLDDRLPGRFNRIVSHSRDETRCVVHSRSDRSLGDYHLLESPESGPLSMRKLFDASPWLDDGEMAELESISYRSRDGLEIHGYLTRPRGTARSVVPMVVLPHGGPWYRDAWGFDPEVQFLANRGHAVLCVNFRGSTGYGRRFLEAGYGQWGRTMQDDVTDGVAWAVEHGIADPDRIAIYGGSYGGFAALSGLIRTSELYACGVSYCGVSNLFTWMAAIPPYMKKFLGMLYEMVGHPERDAERFRETSPLFNVERIRVPLLVAQGANDPRVRKEESDQIVAALRGRGVEVEYIVKDDEGHGFENEENVFDFYRALEGFLERHLAVEATDGGSIADSSVASRS